MQYISGYNLKKEVSFLLFYNILVHPSQSFDVILMLFLGIICTLRISFYLLSYYYYFINNFIWNICVDDDVSIEVDLNLPCFLSWYLKRTCFNAKLEIEISNTFMFNIEINFMFGLDLFYYLSFY